MTNIITKTAYEANTGRLRWQSSGPEGIVAYPPVDGMEWLDGAWSGDTHYVLDGSAAARPETGLPTSHTIAADTDWLVPNAPEGTLVLIDGDESGTVGTGDLVISFALAGEWLVELRPPFPWIEARCKVTVT